MMRRFLLLVLLFGCGGDVESTNNPLQPVECADRPPFDCPCGSPVTTEDRAEFEPLGEQIAEFSVLACDIVGPSLIGECSDGKTLLYINGGLGHTALYYDGDKQLVGTTTSSDVGYQCCPSSYYHGALQDVTCQLVRVEPLCPRSTQPIELPPDYLPYADGQLSPWCDPIR